MKYNVRPMSKFITLEGGEGAGKSTTIRFIENELRKRNIPYIITREPGGTPIAEKIRDIVLTPQNEFMFADTEALLMFAARAQHIQAVIQPALQSGKCVISDRFTDASFAYQCGGRGISIERLRALATWVLGDFKPDLTLLLDIPVQAGLDRIRSRETADRIEQEKNDFFERVRTMYLQLAKEDPKRFHVIHAEKPLNEVEMQIQAALKNIVV